MRALSALTVSLAVVASLTFAATPAQAATSDSASVFAQTNAQRVKAGVKPLIADVTLDRAATAWAKVLASTCSFKHSTSTWRADRVAKAGWSATGENIAAGYSASAVVPAWMASSGHRRNILDSRYTGVGIGYAKGTCYSTYWVQIFGWTKTAAPAGAGDANGDLDADVLATDDDGRLLAYRGNGSGGWDGKTVVGSGWADDDKLVTLGDFTGDGIADVGRIGEDGTFELLRGSGRSSYAAPVVIGTGWDKYRYVIGGIDFNGDRRTDVIGVTPGGTVVYHRGTGAGKFSGSWTVGSGWGTFTAAFYAADFNGDTRGDIMVRKADGSLWLYTPTGKGGWMTPQKLGGNLASATAIFSPGDLNGSGKPDFLTRKADGSLVLWRGNGKGGWATAVTVGSGWNGFNDFG